MVSQTDEHGAEPAAAKTRSEMVRAFLQFARHCLPVADEVKADAYVAHGVEALPAADIIAKAAGGRVYCDVIETPSFTQRSVKYDWHPADHALFDHATDAYLRGADGISTIGWALGYELRGYGPPVSVIPNYRSAEELRPSPEIRHLCGLGAGDVLLLASSTICGGFDPVVEALKLLPENVHLATLGTVVPEYRERLYAYPAEIGVERRVHFLDEVPYAQLTAKASGANLGLMALDPSLTNDRLALPNRLFDSISAGLPIVTPDVPDIARIVLERQIGTVVPIHEARAWADAVSAALGAEHEMRPRVLQAAKELVWETLANDVCRAYGHPASVTIIAFKALAGHQRTLRMAATLVNSGASVTICCPRDPRNSTDDIPGVRFVFTPNPLDLEHEAPTQKPARYDALAVDLASDPLGDGPPAGAPAASIGLLAPKLLSETLLSRAAMPQHPRLDLLHRLQGAYAAQAQMKLHEVWHVKLGTAEDEPPAAAADLAFRDIFEEMTSEYWCGSWGARPADGAQTRQLREFLAANGIAAPDWTALLDELERDPQQARNFEILSIGELAVLSRFLAKYRSNGDRPLRVLEVGGGFGRLGHVFLKLNRPATYVNVDLVPHSLAMSHQFLAENHPGIEVTLAETAASASRFFAEARCDQSSAVVLPAWHIEAVPADYFDVLINIASFQEMSESAIATYIALFDRSARPAAIVMLSNSRDYPYAKDIVYPSNWQLHYKDVSMRSFMGDYPLEVFRITRRPLPPEVNRPLEDRYNRKAIERYREECGRRYLAAKQAAAEHAKLEAELPALRYKAARWDELPVPSLLRKAEQYDALERELPALRLKAERCDALETELPALRYKAEQWDKLPVPSLLHKAEQFEALAPELPALRYKAEQWDKLPVPSLLHKAEQFEALAPELPALRYKAEQWDKLPVPSLVRKAEQYDALERELPALRYKAERYDALEPQLPALRYKAEQWDRLPLASLLRKAEQYDALEPELPGLFHRARQYEAIEPRLRAAEKGWRHVLLQAAGITSASAATGTELPDR